MASSSNTTKDHEEIRSWAEERGGRPAHVKSTGSKDDIGILRIEFPGAPGSNDSALEELSWDQFFEKFDERGLALLYQEETAGGEKSNFNKLVSSETADEAESGKSRRKSSARRGAKNTGVTKKAAAKTSATSKKRAPAKKGATAKKAAVRKSTSKKAVSKKTVPSKATGRSSTSKKAVKKAAKKTAGAKRTATKKSSRRR